jgi:hypothetical protein
VNEIEPALEILSQISRSTHGAKAIMDAGAVDFVFANLIETPSTEVRGWTCKVLANLTSHNSIAMSVVGVGVCVKLVALLW